MAYRPVVLIAHRHDDLLASLRAALPAELAEAIEV
jgi:hypothetical protein